MASGNKGFLANVVGLVSSPKVAATVLVADATKKAVIQTAKTIKSNYGPKSLTRMAKESIFQFPMIVSSSIDTDEVTVLAKSNDKNNAAFLLSVLSMENSVDHAKYDSITDYLKNFHTNSRIPVEISSNPILESAIIPDSVTVDVELVNSLWDRVEDKINMESLNEVYQPYKASKKILMESLAKITQSKAEVAMEAGFSGAVHTAKTSKTHGATAFDTARSNMPSDAQAIIDIAGDLKANSPKSIGDWYGSKNKVDLKGKNDAGAGQIIDDRTLGSVAPTMVNVTLMNYDSAANNSVAWTQSVIIGVKSMVRLVRSNLMVANMSEAAKDGLPFKFIAWTKGEFKLAELLTGHEKYKDMALPTANNRWLKRLKALKARSSASKFVPYMKRLLPNTTIIMTSTEAIMVKDMTGVDLNDTAQAKRIIKNYFLLGLGIYDTEAKTLNMLYDGDEEFATVSLRQLTAIVRKDTNLLDVNG